MLLAVDVGNTNITLGVFKDGVLIGNFRLNTRIARTSDEYGIAIRNILYHNGIDHNEVRDCIIASVVPAVMHSLTSGVIKYFDAKPLIVGAGV